MAFLITSFVLTLITVSWSRPLHESKTAEILRFGNENNGFGKYSFSFETSDGIQRQETGVVINPDSDTSPLVVRGFYAYVGQDGHAYDVHYVADENGFQPKLVKTKADLPQPKYKLKEILPSTTTENQEALHTESTDKSTADPTTPQHKPTEEPPYTTTTGQPQVTIIPILSSHAIGTLAATLADSRPPDTPKAAEIKKAELVKEQASPEKSSTSLKKEVENSEPHSSTPSIEKETSVINENDSQSEVTPNSIDATTTAKSFAPYLGKFAIKTLTGK